MSHTSTVARPIITFTSDEEKMIPRILGAFRRYQRDMDVKEVAGVVHYTDVSIKPIGYLDLVRNVMMKLVQLENLFLTDNGFSTREGGSTSRRNRRSKKKPTKKSSKDKRSPRTGGARFA